jgi:hypothetical protein
MPTLLRQGVAALAFFGPRSRATATTRQGCAINTVGATQPAERPRMGPAPAGATTPCDPDAGMRLDARDRAAGQVARGCGRRAPFAAAWKAARQAGVEEAITTCPRPSPASVGRRTHSRAT